MICNTVRIVQRAGMPSRSLIKFKSFQRKDRKKVKVYNKKCDFRYDKGNIHLINEKI